MQNQQVKLSFDSGSYSIYCKHLN